jgi:hypothetical protein
VEVSDSGGSPRISTQALRSLSEPSYSPPMSTP